MKLLEVKRPMDSWNDERLDEMSRRMDDGFKEMRERFERVEWRSDQRFERLYFVLITASIGLVVSNFLT